MNNLIQQAIDYSDGDKAAKILQQALGIDSDDVWLQMEARFLA